MRNFVKKELCWICNVEDILKIGRCGFCNNKKQAYVCFNEADWLIIKNSKKILFMLIFLKF
jgi:hypothetical protein